MTDDDILLASAYLDDDVTPEERARVESDSEVLAEVDRLRLTRALLGDTEPAPISMRERHLAAAFDVWDRLPDVERVAAVRDQTPAGVSAAAAAGASSVSVSRPSSLAARRATRNRGWMLAAAAGLVVVLGAGVVLNSIDQADDSDSSAPADAPAATDSPAAEDLAPAPDDFALELAEEARTGDVVAGEADAIDPPGGAEAPPPEEEVVELTSPAQLADYVCSVLEATTSPAPDVALETADTEAASGDTTDGFDVRRCPGIEIVVGPASYNGELVVVGIDLGSDEAVASRFDDCVEIARSRLP